MSGGHVPGGLPHRSGLQRGALCAAFAAGRPDRRRGTLTAGGEGLQPGAGLPVGLCQPGGHPRL